MKVFRETLESAVVIVEADVFGKSVENAKYDFICGEKYKGLVQSLLNAMNDVGYINGVPDLVVKEGLSSEGLPQVTINVVFRDIGKHIGDEKGFGDHIPVALAATTNRLVWSAANHNCDIYATDPMFDFLQTKMNEVISHFAVAKFNLSELSMKVDFPNIRHEVNMGILTAKDILKIRECSQKFRSWFHEQTDLQKDIISSYLLEVAEKSGVKPKASKFLKIMSVAIAATLGGLAGSAVSKNLGGIAGAGSSALAQAFITDLFETIYGGWHPKIFGDKLKKISNT